jgi:flagellar biosynthesis GTPase FlhF
MSYDLFIGNYDKLMDGVYGSGVDVTNIFELLKDKKKLAKNLYLLSNPYATQQDADLIFDSTEELLEKIDKEFEEEETEDEFDDVYYDPDEGNLTPEEKKDKKRRESEEKKEEKESVRNEKKEEKERKKREREEEKKRRKDEIKELKKVYTDEATERFYNEADEFKTELRKSTFVLSQQVKEVGTSLSLLVLSYSTAIPAIVIDVSPLSFNFPGAFDRLIQVIVDLITAYTSFQKATQFLDKGFRVAPRILDNKSLSVLGSFLNPIVIALNALFKPLTLLYGLVRKLVEALKKNIFRKR